MLNNPILECVPNFSEGKDMSVIRQISQIIAEIKNVKLLHIDSGKAANRTVITFAGSPEQVVEAAFNAIKKASELIDMQQHKGEHPRIGATDVCPLVPVKNISMQETVAFARELANRVGEELGIPVYCYEYAAFFKDRKNLANCRSGEYEGLESKLTNPGWKPDFGPAEFNPGAGATVIGARDFLIAYNINLNTTSAKTAREIAVKIRESGYLKRVGETSGKNGSNIIRIPGVLKNVKAIGWYIEEYNKAQVSMNLTNINNTPLHIVFEEVCKQANRTGAEVTGSEIIGLVPLKVLIDAGKHFIIKSGKELNQPEAIIINKAVKELNLNDAKPFNPNERIIEYLL